MKIRENIEIHHWNVSWDEIPCRIQDLFSEREGAYYKNLIIERSKIIESCEIDSIKKFFKNLESNNHCRVYIKSEDLQRPMVYWYTFFVAEHDGVSFRLPSGTKLPGNPPMLVSKLYEFIGGIDENLEYFCGWHAPESIISMKDSDYEINNMDLSLFFPLFSFGNGDHVGYISGKNGYLYSHEENEMYELDLTEFINNYFGNFFKRRGDETE